MKIGLIRHAKVIRKDPFFSSGAAFNEGRKRYDETLPEIVTLKIKAEDFPVCYASSMLRAIETAKMIYPGKFIITDELIEAKNAAIFLEGVKLPTIFRKLIERLAWFFNNKKMPETKRESFERAEKFIRHLLSETKADTLLISHGFFMHCLQRELRKQGFKGRIDFFTKNTTLYIFER